jgi:hypothetical protein
MNRFAASGVFSPLAAAFDFPYRVELKPVVECLAGLVDAV